MDTTALLGSIKTAIDITKIIGNTIKDNSLNNKTRELTHAIIETQSQVLAMYAEYQRVLQANHDISQKLMKFENWGKEKEKYKLVEISKGVITYAFDSSQDPSIPSHYICKNCYNEQKISILDPVFMQDEGSQYVCPRCKTVINTHVDSPSVFSI